MALEDATNPPRRSPHILTEATAPPGGRTDQSLPSFAYEGVPQPPTSAVHLARPAGPSPAGALLSCKPERKKKGHRDRRTEYSAAFIHGRALLSPRGILNAMGPRP